MAYTIFPTNGDVGDAGTPSGGVATEQNLAGLFSGLISRNRAFVASGLTVTIGTGLGIDIAAGAAVVNGMRFESDAVIVHTATASVTDEYLWLRLDRTSDLVTGYTLVETSTVVPVDDDHLLLGQFTTSGSAVTALDGAQRQPPPGPVFGTYTGNNASNRTIELGFTPSFVIVFCLEVASSSRLVGFSGPLMPGEDPTATPYINNGGLSFAGSGPTVRIGGGRQYEPRCVTGGFQIQDGVPSLNSAHLYRYVAWP